MPNDTHGAVSLLVFHLTWLHCSVSLGSFISNNDGDGNKNVAETVNVCCFRLYRAYSIFFNSSNVSYFFWSFILKNYRKRKLLSCVQIQEAKSVKLGIFTSYSCNDSREMYQKGWCTCGVVVLPTQTHCAFLPFSLTSPLLLLLYIPPPPSSTNALSQTVQLVQSNLIMALETLSCFSTNKCLKTFVSYFLLNQLIFPGSSLRIVMCVDLYS